VTFAELVSTFTAQGFDYLQASEAEAYLNDAYLLDICEAEDWPFLEATATGAAPLTISDLRAVEYVLDSAQETKLSPVDRKGLTDSSVNLAEVGTPTHYYLTEGTTLNLFPTSTDTLSVRYFKTPPRLTGTASPVLPERFHSLIVTGAVARAYENSDDWELAQSAANAFAVRLDRMRESLLAQYRDGPSEYIAVTDEYAL